MKKKSFINGIIIPTKIKSCNGCSDKVIFITCKNQPNENKEFEANINVIKSQALNQFSYLLPYFKEKFNVIEMSTNLIQLHQNKIITNWDR